MDREEIIRTSLKNRGALILTKDIAEAIQISNSIAQSILSFQLKTLRVLLIKSNMRVQSLWASTLLKRLEIIALEQTMSFQRQVLQGFHHRLESMTLQRDLASLWLQKKAPINLVRLPQRWLMVKAFRRMHYRLFIEQTKSTSQALLGNIRFL